MSIKKKSTIAWLVITAFAPIAQGEDWLGASYAECVTKNLSGIAGEIAAINILNVCFNRFCSKTTDAVLAPPLRLDKQFNSKKHSFTTTADGECDNYKDGPEQLQIRSRCSASRYAWEYDETCP